MKLLIKKEYLDGRMSCPISGNLEYVRFLDPIMYQHWYARGYNWLFDIIEEPKIEDKSKK